MHIFYRDDFGCYSQKILAQMYSIHAQSYFSITGTMQHKKCHVNFRAKQKILGSFLSVMTSLGNCRHHLYFYSENTEN